MYICFPSALTFWINVYDKPSSWVPCRLQGEGPALLSPADGVLASSCLNSTAP